MIKKVHVILLILVFGFSFLLSGCTEDVPTVKVTGYENKSYFQGDELDLDSLKIVFEYKDGRVEEVDAVSSYFDSLSLDSAGSKVINVTLSKDGKEYKTSFTVSVLEKTVVSDTVDITKKDYFIGESIDASTITLTVKYNNQTEEVIPVTADMLSDTTFTTVGEHQVKISYTVDGTIKETSFTVNYSQLKAIEKVEFITTHDNVYLVGEYFNLELSSLKVTYEDATTEVIPVTSEMLSAFQLLEEGFIDIMINYQGATTMTTVEVLSEEDYEYYLEDIQYRLDIEKALNEAIEAVKQTIPEQTSGNLDLIFTYANTEIQIRYASSNESAMSISGIVTPQDEDVTVTVTVSLWAKSFSDLKDELTFDILIPGLGPIVLKDITNRKLVFAYVYSGTGTNIREADYPKIDVINYCFARVSENGVSIDSGTLSGLERLVKLRREAGIRIVLSLGGGGSGSLGFSPGCLTKESRGRVISDLLKLAEEYQLDGFDLDWEYPGWNGLADSHPDVDKANFISLCQELRAAMDEYREGMLLTSAVIAGDSVSSVLRFFDVPKLNLYLDYLHLMTYDLNASSNVTHNSNLYPYQGRIYSGDNSVKIYAAAGFDKTRLVIGAAFYGKRFTLTTPSSPSTSLIMQPASDVRSIQYSTVATLLNDNSYTKLYDDTAKINFLTNGKEVIAYESPEDMRTKTQYVYDQNIGGIMFWDYGSDSTGTLLNSIYVTMWENENKNK